jgi:hypothetical protein
LADGFVSLPFAKDFFMPRRACSAKFQLWTERIEAFKASGLSVAQFCKELPCSPNSLYGWKRRLDASAQPQRAQGNAKPAQRAQGNHQPTSARHIKQSAFLPIVLRAGAELHVAIRLPSGVSIEVPCQAIDAIRVVLEQVA